MTSPLRVVACIYDLRVGGAETSLLAEYRRLHQYNIDASVLCLGEDRTLEKEFAAAGVPVTFVPPGSRWSRGRYIVRFLRHGNFALVHTMLFWPDVIVRPLARLCRIPVVSSLTNEYYGKEHRQHSHHGALGVIVAQVADALTAKCAAGFHAISARSGEIMARRLGIRNSRITVIYRGRDLNELGRRTPQRRLAVREKWGLRSTFVFLCVGRQDYQKAHEIAVLAFSELAGEFPDSVLWLAGREGGNSPLVQSAIAQSPYRDRIVCLGERSDVPDLLTAADAFVMPSRFEGLAGSVIEAMSLEVPLVLTDIPVFREVADNRALFFRRDDVAGLAASLRAVAAGEYPAGWVEELRERAEQVFDIESVTAELADFYVKNCRKLPPRPRTGGF